MFGDRRPEQAQAGLVDDAPVPACFGSHDIDAVRTAIHLEQDVYDLLMTGVLGGYTTFSAFSLDAALLWAQGKLWLAVLYVSASVILALLGVFVGLGIMRSQL